jgi:hypothetical protein
MSGDDDERRRLRRIAHELLHMRRMDERVRASPLFRQLQETAQFWQDLIREAEQEEAARSRPEPPVSEPPPAPEPELTDAACNALAAALGSLAVTETGDTFAANASGVQQEPSGPPPELKDAPQDGEAIRDSIRTVNSRYPKGAAPNLNELVPLAKNDLKGKGLKASKDHIQKIANEKEFAEMRRPSGVRRS